MITPTARPIGITSLAPQRPSRRQSQALLAVLGIALLAVMPGCGTAPGPKGPTQAITPEVLTIREADVVRISFPGTPALDTQQQVRRDGRITLGMVGEVLAIGKTPAELEKELLKVYGDQIMAKEVSVTVVSSNFSVFVTGAVLRPGKIQTDHPITALEAVMEAGGFVSGRADMKNVVVIRQVDGQTVNSKLNLKDVLEGKSGDLYYLNPSDILFVPEKFSWF